MQMYLAGGEIEVVSYCIRGIHEYLRHRGQVFNTLHPQPKKMPVYTLAMNSLKKKR